jgi:hypothetical protein
VFIERLLQSKIKADGPTVSDDIKRTTRVKFGTLTADREPCDPAASGGFFLDVAAEWRYHFSKYVGWTGSPAHPVPFLVLAKSNLGVEK